MDKDDCLSNKDDCLITSETGAEEEAPGSVRIEKYLLECPAEFILQNSAEVNLTKGESLIKVGREDFVVELKQGEVLSFSYREISEVTALNYQVKLLLTSEEIITVSSLGYNYEDFLRNFYRSRNEILLKDLLMDEKLRHPGMKAEFVFKDEGGRQTDSQPCELRFYETGLVIIPETSDIVRIPYSDFLNYEANDYRITITTEYSEILVLGMLGKMYDPFLKMLGEIINELNLRVQTLIKDILPDAEGTSIRNLTRIIKEGKAVQKVAIDQVEPRFWDQLEKRLESAGIKGDYDYLKSLGVTDKLCIGFKRGLLGDLSGDYYWFLVPIYGLNPETPGNIVAMEAVSEAGWGRATYFFKIVSRAEYRNLSNLDELNQKVDCFIRKINRALIAVNFRREPVYLTEDKLSKPEYIKYRFSIKKLPELQFLRDCFVGRVIHNNPEQWSKDVAALLRFNVSAATEDKWEKER